MELIQDISRVFGKWFGGEQLMGDEIKFITFCIIIGVLLIICIILLLCLAYESHLWRSIRWAFSTCLNLQSETVALSCKHQPVRSMVMQSSTLRKKAIMAMSTPLASALVTMKAKDVQSHFVWINTENLVSRLKL